MSLESCIVHTPMPLLTSSFGLHAGNMPRLCRRRRGPAGHQQLHLLNPWRGLCRSGRRGTRHGLRRIALEIAQHRSASLNAAQHRSTSLNIAQPRSTSLSIVQHCSQYRSASLNIAQHRSASLSIAQHRSASLNIAQHRSTSLSIAQHRSMLSYS